MTTIQIQAAYRALRRQYVRRFFELRPGSTVHAEAVNGLARGLCLPADALTMALAETGHGVAP
jgi:hypothetical protein